AGGGRASRAFELAERRRARELRDRLARAQALRTDTSAASGDRPTTLQSAALSADDMGALLPDGRTVILEYVTGGLGAPTTLFVLTRATGSGVSVRARILPPADSLAGQ